MTSIEKEFIILRDKIIQNYFRHLNGEQLQAALSNSNMVLTAACPGAGKTQVIVNRIIYLTSFGLSYNSDQVPKDIREDNILELREFLKLKSGTIPSCLKSSFVPAGNIAVITFTKAAAVNMKERYLRISGSKEAPFFGTIHSLFYSVLRDYRNFGIISDLEQYRVIKGVLDKYTDGYKAEDIRRIINEFALVKSKGKLLQGKTRTDYNILLECSKAYEAYKEERALLDFNDMITSCIRLFETNKDILNKYRRKFRHILVDEFQDCDSDQIYMLQLLSKFSHLFAVGDEDQCIYGFRGSRPDCMVEFDDYFKGGIKYFLNKNYRSTSNIIEGSRKLISNNNNRNPKEMTAARKEQGSISILDFNTEEEQADGLIELIVSKGYKPSECAVLTRTNQEAEKVICSLIRNKINFKLMDKSWNFFNIDVCRDIEAYFRLSQNPFCKESFIRIINRPFRYISKVKLSKINSCCSSRNWFHFLMEEKDMQPWQIKNIRKLEKGINKLSKLKTEKALDFLLDKIGYREQVASYKMDILTEFKDLCRIYKTIPELLDYIEIHNRKLAENEKDALVLSTIHGVKGLEYKNVFVINCCSGNMPHENSLENIEEERRLFYVAVTRAIDNLHILYPVAFKGNISEPSPFINEYM